MTVFDAALQFAFDVRLGIRTPQLTMDWEMFTASEQAEILLYWEQVRGVIPNQIFALERDIGVLQQQMNEEENFERVCELNSEIAELASRIHDLNIYFRLNQDVAARAHH